MYEAWKATSERERVRLARRALEISPDCADAYVLLAEETTSSAKEAADLYAKGVAAGERTLGPEFFEENAGHFWGIIETRPYMRARAGLAETLWELGRRGEAIEHVQEILRLNPGDNQGIRYVLLGWLLQLNRAEETEKLLDSYPDELSAMWTYGKALHLFRTEGPSPEAGQALAWTRKANPHVPAYLLGHKKMPRQLPEYMGMGDEDEAVICVSEQGEAWRRTKGALDWLLRDRTEIEIPGLPDLSVLGTPGKWALFLNPYWSRFTRCPECGEKTKVRKVFLVTLFDEGLFTAIPQQVRVCEGCTVMIVHQDELEADFELALEAKGHPEQIGADYLALLCQL